jgi:hypothetical protein
MRLWTTKETAEMIGVSPRLVQVYRELGFYTPTVNPHGKGKVVKHLALEVIGAAVVIRGVKSGITRQEMREVDVPLIVTGICNETGKRNNPEVFVTFWLSKDGRVTSCYVSANPSDYAGAWEGGSTVIINMTDLTKQLLFEGG